MDFFSWPRYSNDLYPYHFSVLCVVDQNASVHFDCINYVLFSEFQVQNIVLGSNEIFIGALAS